MAHEDVSVLIVDDDPDVRDVLRLLFETEGYRIAGEAADGVEAVALAIRERPDVILLDHMMPRRSGEKTAPMLRTVAPEAKIVAFSAYLTAPPQWADAYLDKERIGQIAPLLAELLPRRPRTRA